MEQRKSQKKEIAREANTLLNQGTSKQQVFETLVDKYKYSKDVAQVLRGIPSLTRIRKYDAWNNLLLVLLIIVEIMALFSKSLFAILWYAVLVYAVAKKKANYYGWITFYSIIGAVVGTMILLVNSKPTDTIFFIFLAVQIPICMLSIWLEKKLFTDPIEKTEMYTNENGEMGSRLVYEFIDETTNPMTITPMTNGQ